MYKPQYRKEYRQNKELSLLEEYFAWLKIIHPEKGSKLEEAVRYSLNQKQQLCAFLDNGEVPISNNLAENAIRPFTLGRKNWLFYNTPICAEASAVLHKNVKADFSLASRRIKHHKNWLLCLECSSRLLLTVRLTQNSLQCIYRYRGERYGKDKDDESPSERYGQAGSGGRVQAAGGPMATAVDMFCAQLP